MKIKKVEKLLANLQDITEYFIPIRNLKHALNQMILKKIFFKLMNNAVFKKAMDVRKRGENKIVITER